MIDETFRKETLANAGMAEKLNAAFDATGVTFHNRAAALKDFKADGRDFTVDADGTLTTFFDGQKIKASEAFLRFAYDRRDLVDNRSMPREGVGVGRPGLQAKSDFPDIASRVAYINTYGEEAFARLPLTSPTPDGEITTREQFDALPRSEKVARINADEFCRAKLPSAPKPHPHQKALDHKQGTADNLAKHIASRGVGKR